MGLLDKALRGQDQAAGKAAAPPPGRAAFSVAEESLPGLIRDLSALPPTADYHLGAFARIAEALPLPALGLLWPGAEGYVLAAARGLPARGGRPLSPGPFERIRKAFPLDDAFIGLLSPLLELPPDMAFRLQALTDSEGSVRGLWLYGAPGFERAAPALTDALDAVFAAASGRASPPGPLGGTASLASPELLREGGERAIALLFKLEALLLGVERRGIRQAEALAAVGAAAARVLGSSGAAFSPGPARLGLLLYSGYPADEELVLAQFRKSLRRALGLLGPAAEAPAAALALSLEDPGAASLLERFLRS